MPYKLQPAALGEKWERYCRECDENMETVRYRDTLVQVPKKVIYTVEGFCNYAGIAEADLEAFEKNKNYKALLKNIHFAVLCRKLHALVNGEGSSTGLVFDLKANYGLHARKYAKNEEWKITFDLGNPAVEALEGSTK